MICGGPARRSFIAGRRRGCGHPPGAWRPRACRAGPGRLPDRGRPQIGECVHGILPFLRGFPAPGFDIALAQRAGRDRLRHDVLVAGAAAEIAFQPVADGLSWFVALRSTRSTAVMIMPGVQ